MVDMAEEGSDPLEVLHTLKAEAEAYDVWNTRKPWVVLGTKCDMLTHEPLLRLDSLYYRLQALYGDVPVVGTSARFGLGISRAVEAVREALLPVRVVPSTRTPAEAPPLSLAAGTLTT